jgi:hypothetical protein
MLAYDGHAHHIVACTQALHRSNHMAAHGIQLALGFPLLLLSGGLS